MIKTTCIIPDLHLRWRQAEKIVNHVGADQYIFTGDFFDDFCDDPQQVNEMIDWLEGAVKMKNWKFTYGNHDCHYAFPEEHWRCSGYAQWKHFIIRDRLPMKWFEEHFRFYHVLDGTFLLSHAGLDRRHLPKTIAALHVDRPLFLKELTAYLDAQIIEGHRQNSWVFHSGRGRGGFQEAGGITWCDFDREFQPIRGLNQIVGHTPQGNSTAHWLRWHKHRKPDRISIGKWTPTPEDYKDVNQSINLCLDVYRNTHWAIWNGQTLKFGNYLDDM